MKIVERIVQSCQARFIQPYMIKHYENTKYGKIIASYKNVYKGQKCFLIGNGPSLKAKDLDLIQERNIPTFAFNRIYNIFDQTQWRPMFYISQDEKMLGGCSDFVNKIDCTVKFIPIQLNWYDSICIDDAVYINLIGQRADNPDDFLFSDNASNCVYNASTCMYTAAQMAVYMGFTEIYLIGVDHHFQISQNNKGEIIVDNSVKDYFTDKYNEDKENLYIPNTEKSTLTYIAMKNHCDKRGVKVYNATRGGKLEVFQRVDFERVLEG